MRNALKYFFTILLFSTAVPILNSQNETKKWFFGTGAALDFASGTPTLISNSSMSVAEGCASVADANANLLFYTDGETIFTQSHTVMANGSGLSGSITPSQSSLIFQQPGNASIYYLFTLNYQTGVKYSIIDMSLAAGEGSVITKNAAMFSGYVEEKLTGTRHCNGSDYLITIKTYSANTTGFDFITYTFGAGGVNPNPVITPAVNTYSWNNVLGCMKISPTGKHLALANYNGNVNNVGLSPFVLYDYDNSTGVVSNSLGLAGTNIASAGGSGYGVEFSPDGTKLYGTKVNSGVIYQWNLCAGSPSAIIASQATVGVTFGSFIQLGSLQLAPNGKIYCARVGSSVGSTLSVINSPNLTGSACGYSVNGPALNPYWCAMGLPNFIGSSFVQPLPMPPYSYTANNVQGCHVTNFISPAIPNTTIGCSSSVFSVVSIQWDFGDPASGANNTSTLTNPTHAFTHMGTFTTQLIVNFSCGGSSDTLRQAINISQSCLSITSNSISCAQLGSATVTPVTGLGPFTYTWFPGAQTGSVASSLNPGTYSVVVHDSGTNFTYTDYVSFTPPVQYSAQISYQQMLRCNAASNGSAICTNVTGGSGTANYLWTNGSVSYSTAGINALSVGQWSVIITDPVSSCQVSHAFFVSQPLPVVLNITSSSPSACVNSAIGYTAVGSGGVGSPYSYIWTNGPVTHTTSIAQNTGGTYVYTVTTFDANNCSATQTTGAGFIPTPTIIIASTSVCPLQTGTITASGASNYTWSNNGTGNVLTDSPLSSSIYYVIGEAQTCTGSATGTITVNSPPSPNIVSNSPVCEGHALTMVGTGGAGYMWSGPLNFTASSQSPFISGATSGNSGVYSVTVTAANSCTALSTVSVTVNHTPTVSAAGSHVCSTQTMNLSASSEPGATFSWSGPSNFSSGIQNPALPLPTINNAGAYTLIVTSLLGCTNIAITSASVTTYVQPVLNSNAPRCVGDQLSFVGTGGSTYLWSGPAGFSSALQNPQIQGVQMNANGVYTLVTTTGPCVSDSTVAVIVHQLPVPASVYQAPVCEKSPLTMIGSSTKTVTAWMWVGPAGFVSAQQYPKIDSTKLANSGIYTLNVIDSDGCTNTATMVVNIEPNPVLTATGGTVCIFDRAVLHATGADSYYWTGPSLYTAYTQTAVINKAQSSAVNIYTVVGAAPNTCTGVATASLFTWPLPVPLVSTSSAFVCVGNYFTLTGDGGKFYRWDGPGALKSDGPLLKILAENAGLSGHYSLTVTDENLCYATISASITVSGLPSGYLSMSKAEGCVPFCSEMKYLPAPHSNSIAHAGFNIERYSYEKAFTHCFLEAGDYQITSNIIDVYGCISRPTYTVHARKKPVAAFTHGPVNPVEGIEEVQFTELSNEAPGASFKWFVGDADGRSAHGYALAENNSPAFSRMFQNAGNFPVALVVTNAFGCSDTAVKAIAVQADLLVYVPNAFTPNGDGKNEIFLPVTRSLKQYHLVIYNRIGNLIFETADPLQGWDGAIGGEPCKEDVYAWKLILSYVSGERKELEGRVVLYR